MAYHYNTNPMKCDKKKKEQVNGRYSVKMCWTSKWLVCEMKVINQRTIKVTKTEGREVTL